jgi:hypothetical protein
MTTVALTQDPILQFFSTSTGAPLAGGTLLTQVGGVNYPTYSDAAGTVPLPNPIVLNSRGEVATNAGDSTPLYTVPNVAYTYTLSDSLGNVIWTAPNITTAPSAAILAVLTQQVLGGILWPRTAAEITAGVTPTNYAYMEGNVLRYGADSTNVASSVTSFANAALVTKSVFVPPGSYKFPSGITLRADTTLYGLNPENTFLNYTGGAGTFITLTNGGYAHLEGLSIYGNGSSGGAYFTAGTIGISINGNVTVTRCEIRFWEKACAWVVGGFYLKFYDTTFGYSSICCYNFNANNTSFFGTKFIFCDYGVQVGGFDGPITFYGGSIENCTTAFLVLIGGGLSSVAIHGLYIENTGATSVAGTGLNTNGYKQAVLVQGAWKQIALHGCCGQIAGWKRIVDATTGSGNVIGEGNHWIYKLDGGLSDTQFIYAVAAGGNVIISDSSEGRSDVTYTPAATYTITGAFLSAGPKAALGFDPVSQLPLASAFAQQTLTYSASINTDASLGAGNPTTFVIAPNNGTAFTINNPTNSYQGQQITYRILNTFGVLGALTFGANMKASAWTQPANGFSRAITFEYDGTNWKQISQTGVDIPN